MAAVNAAKEPRTIPQIGFSEFSNSVNPIMLIISIMSTPIITSLGFIFRLYTQGSMSAVKKVPVENEIMVMEILATFIPPKKHNQ